jgi:hypothetical protein
LSVKYMKRTLVNLNPKAVMKVALACLFVVAPAALVAQGESGSAAAGDLRLSGVVAMGGEMRLAVVERPGQGGRLVRAGDTLSDGSRVLEIGPDSMRLALNGKERVLQVAGLRPAGAAEPGAAVGSAGGGAQPPSADQPLMSSAKANAEILDALSRLASDPRASEDDLGFVLAPLLDVPAGSSIRPFFPGQPELEDKGLSEMRAILDRGQVVRLKVDSGGQERMVYLMKEPANADSADSDVP